MRVICDNCGADMTGQGAPMTEIKTTKIADKTFTVEHQIKVFSGDSPDYDICSKCRDGILKASLAEQA